MKNSAYSIVPSQQRGMTLIELLIALALSLAVLIGLSAVYIAAKQAFRFQENTGRLQEDANFALDTISKELRMAGFAGCAGIKTVTVAGTTTRYPGSRLVSGSPSGLDGPNPLAQVDTLVPEVTVQPFTTANFIRGFDDVPSSLFPTGGAPTSSDTGSVFFASASANSVGVSAPMAAASSPLTIAADTYGWGATARNMIISDCSSSSLFEGTVGTTGGVTAIAHDGVGNSVGTFTSDHQFGTDAVVMLAQWSFYYVATRTGASTPSLYRVTFNGTTRSNQEEIVSNVESMQLHYGENTLDVSGVPTLVADQWRTTAAAVTDWSRVVAVRVGLMMVSTEDNTSPDVTLTTPTLLGQTYTKPSGSSANRLRKEFSTTVVIRNSVAAR
jgi:type IV pilus assembly protein PilW